MINMIIICIFCNSICFLKLKLIERNNKVIGSFFKVNERIFD